MTEYQERQDALDQRIVEDIAKHGWSDMFIFPTQEDHGLPFNYTVGFSTRDHHPEILMMGLDGKVMHQILGSAYELVKSGTRFQPDRYYNFILQGLRVAFVEIDDPVDNTRYPMSMTRRIIGEFQALQLVWPDEKDRFPWHEDYNSDYREYQELLGTWRGED